MKHRLSRTFLPWVFYHALEFKGYYLGAFVALYVLQVMQAQLPERIRQLTEMMGRGEALESSVWIFLGLAVGIFIFRTFSRLLFFYPARVQQKLLRMELLDLLQEVSPERYQEKNQGQLFQVLFDDVNNLRAFIGFGLLQIGNLLIAGWVLIPKINQTDSYLWPAFIPLFSSVILFSLMTMFNQRIFKRMMDKKGEVQQYVIESYEAKQTIKNFHREDNFIQGFIRASHQELSLFFKSSLGYAFSGPYVKLGLGGSLLWGGYIIHNRGGSPSDLVFFSGFLYLFLEPVMFLSWVAVVVSQGLAAWKRVKELYLLLVTKTPFEASLIPAKIIGNYLELGFECWGREREIRIQMGVWTVISGETGCGKSFTLSRIASNLILSGKKVSMVQQEPYLFNDTVASNIFLGYRPSADDVIKVKKLLVIFQLDGLAPNLDEVLALEVGENGKRLSGGQIKRIALIRSLMSRSEILIWDDPFSSVDIILERRIIKLLRHSDDWKHHTFILSAHRLTTVRLVDDFIFLEKNSGAQILGAVAEAIKNENVAKFFKEQHLEASLA
jgi:ABC-type multidrug transport system fused ATPase/permease subunit